MAPSLTVPAPPTVLPALDAYVAETLGFDPDFLPVFHPSTPNILFFHPRHFSLCARGSILCQQIAIDR